MAQHPEFRTLPAPPGELVAYDERVDAGSWPTLDAYFEATVTTRPLSA